KNRYITHVYPALAGYKAGQLTPLYRQLRETLEAIPGVKRVSFSLYSPMEGDNWAETVFVEGQAPPPPDSNQNDASWLRASDGYFETIGTKILRGRGFTAEDTASSQRVAVVNQAFARKFFKQEDPVGRHFGDLQAKYSGAFEIVGVTEDTHYGSPRHRV